MNVLIVDDDVGMRVTLQRIVEAEGHRVIVAEDGPGALGVAGESPFDIAFIDYRMVGMNGGDTCAALHRLQPHAELYVMTAHVSSEAAEAALAGGAAGILYKPLDVDRLLGLIADREEGGL
ncbi:MAG: response regulator [Armatimonadetes bacterium]|nr:response regulator [Armatimonadota bacterium]